MKPAKGALPVTYYKSAYGSKYPVYRIADCVPMREKKPVTEAQREAGRRLARACSPLGRAAAKARAWLEDLDPLIIDTETTGLDDHDQVIEIAVVDRLGAVLFESRLRPTVDVSEGAYAVHGIASADLLSESQWPVIAQRLSQVIQGRQVIAFNDEFDCRLLQQTARAFGETFRMQSRCAMGLAAEAFGATNRYGSISLAAAAAAAGVPIICAHTARGDALTTLAVINAIAEQA
ncbi:3'-5' exonuclease family protein [Pseudomonas aeruginosa]